MRKRNRHPDLPDSDLLDTEPLRCCWPACGAITQHDLPLCTAHIAVAHNLHRQLSGGQMPTVRVRVETTEPVRSPAPTPPGTVYYVQVGAHIKIGWTSDLDKRMRSYPPNSALLAAHAGTRQDENRMHKRFAASRTHGREWYAPIPSLLHHIAQMNREHGTPAAVAFGAQPVTIPEPRALRGPVVKTFARRV